MIMVTAASGHVGRPLVAELVASGLKVRALTRTPGARDGFPAEVEPCDSAVPDFEGITALMVNIAGLPGGPVDLLAAAGAAGVRRVVALSSLAVTDPRGATGPGSVAAVHRALEAAVEAGFPEWTHLRPAGFAANALQWRAELRSGDVVHGPYAGARTAPIDEADIAAVAAHALTGDELVGRALSLTGPQELTPAQMTRTLGRVLGRPLRYEEVSPRTARRAMLAATPGAPETLIDSTLEYLAASTGRPALVTGEVARVLGRPPGTFEDWAQAHRTAFTG